MLFWVVFIIIAILVILYNIIENNDFFDYVLGIIGSFALWGIIFFLIWLGVEMGIDPKQEVINTEIVELSAVVDNVENASYGLTNCAERSALFTAYSKGYRKEDILGIAIASLSNEPASPCGACRQVISELMEDEAFVVYGNEQNVVYELKVKDLLPGAFTKENL